MSEGVENPTNQSNEKEYEERKILIKSKIDSLINDKYKIGLISILILALIIRIYFLIISQNQAHWWDTLAFGSLAKNLVFHLWDSTNFIASESVIRPPLFPILWALLIKINFSELWTLILLEFTPSVLSVYLIYLIGKELYDKRIGILASFILAVSWVQLFYTTRIMSDIPSFFFILASIYFFIRSYENINLKFFFLSIFFLSLAVLTRYFYGMIGIIYLVILITANKHHFLKNKSFWLGGILGLIPLLIFFAINLISHGNFLPAAGFYTTSAAEKPGFAYYILGFIPHIFKIVFTILFVIGLIIVLLELFLGFDSINSIKKLRHHLFVILILFFPLIFFIFFLRAAEDRYLFLSFVSFILIISHGIVFVYDYIRKYSKIVAVVLTIILLLFGAYSNLTFGNSLVIEKKTSFLQMKEAFLWIKDNTSKESILVGEWIPPYAIYYAERRFAEGNSTDFDQLLDKSDYLVVNAFHPQDPWVVNYLQNNASSKLAPVKSFFFDENQQQPAVIIYKIEK
ncbi:MAG: glycosyltransferase family 39 protein [Nanoarchaeota archaeon]